MQLPGRGRRKRAATLSLQIRFESLDDETLLARLIESTVWVNEAHPAYRRAVASRAEAYHIALAVAAALAPLAVEPEHEQRSISVFLARRGAAATSGGNAERDQRVRRYSASHVRGIRCDDEPGSAGR